MQEWLLDKYSDDLKYATLFGAHVYGTANEDSDIDLIIVISDRDNINSGYHETFIHPSLGPMDITCYIETEFHNQLKNNEVKVLEAIFAPKEFIIIGNPTIYINILVLHPPSIRHTYGKATRQAWIKGIKKLTLENESKEIRNGKKSLYHSLRLFLFAVQLYETGRISFDDNKLKELNVFYFKIIKMEVNGIIEDKKIKKEFQELYDSLDKQFKKIPNEEQYKQLQKKIMKPK